MKRLSIFANYLLKKMKHLIRYVLLALLAFGMANVQAQERRRVLFIGNSYTQFNNLPQMVADIAESMGEGVEFQSNTPGGCTFEMHCQNQSMVMICEGGWDFVVLQEQSQLPAFPMDSVEMYVFPFAQRLVDSIYAHNPNVEPMFFMTWGRKNGDTEFGYPPMDTYEGMDSLLYARYMQMGEDNDASVCPVGRVWHYLRDHDADIELYTSDGSHPSIAGTYAAACAFNTMFFGRNPDSISYNPGLDQQEARAIRFAVHKVVYDSLWKWQHPGSPSSVFHWESWMPEITVCPNPADDEVVLHLPEGVVAEVVLYGIDGREIWRKKKGNPCNVIALQGLPSGLYVLKVVASQGTAVRRMVKR